MEMHIGVAGFAVFVLYMIIYKAAVQLLNVEARRNGMHVPAAISGLLN